ncbi:hypothetical protein [Hoeflea olei]|uniref:Uncharacterized protein n=1 Tax=Hoeflea olei TaxID=1480615 RepID=A0A1C1YVB3_9HYPH|nr:hypothetical protein [Hoeflea olei]OCW57290.1 hypothetical protein AWJ14_14020 [Hoeflea olei]
MYPDDDFLLGKPGQRESATVVRIALMALAGCLLLLVGVVLQARADSGSLILPPAHAAHTGHSYLVAHGNAKIWTVPDAASTIRFRP